MVSTAWEDEGRDQGDVSVTPKIVSKHHQMPGAWHRTDFSLTALKRSQLCWCPDLRLPEPWGNTFLLLKPPGVWYFVTQPQQTNPTSLAPPLFSIFRAVPSPLVAEGMLGTSSVCSITSGQGLCTHWTSTGWIRLWMAPDRGRGSHGEAAAVVPLPLLPRDGVTQNPQWMRAGFSSTASLPLCL